MVSEVKTPVVLSAKLRCLLGSIHKSLRYFETVHADDLQHKIVKRGLTESNHPFNRIKEVYFNTLGKDFRLILTPNMQIFHPRFDARTIDSDGKETKVHIGNQD